jgi:hypothetical protein
LTDTSQLSYLAGPESLTNGGGMVWALEDTRQYIRASQHLDRIDEEEVRLKEEVK